MTAESTVYVVDGDRSTCEALQALVAQWGWRCQSFASADAFLQQYDDAQPGCVVADIEMSDSEGVGLQDALSTRDSALPVVVLTAVADVKAAVQAMQRGAVSVLVKPYDDEELHATLHRALEINARARHRRQRRWELRHRLERLTPKERQVMDLLVDGKLNKDIASQLHVGLRTVERRRHNILEKMQVGSLPELSRLAVELQSSDCSHSA